MTGNVTGDVTGNADTTTALATGRTIGMTGDVVWTSASFDGSGNVTGATMKLLASSSKHRIIYRISKCCHFEHFRLKWING